MKNRFNVIQINGIKGIIFLAGAVVCLIAGFVVFPGLVMKTGWNLISNMTGALPQIGALQGILLWGIIVVAYFTFKKKGFFVEFKSAHELSSEEMDSVMRRIRAERKSDIIARSIMRAKEMEIEAKNNLDKFEANTAISELKDISDRSDNIENHDMVENQKN